MADKNLPSLDGLIQTKGAPRPDALAQRGDSPARVLQTNLHTSVAAPVPAPAAREPRAKSLTLRLSETQYERLRRFAFDRRLSHQDIIERALVEYLERQERT
jgi:hypothetical protein